jgi:FK506-binding protein 8
VPPPAQALELDPNHIKCLFRRGKCLLDLGDLDAARDDLARVQELDPSNRELLVELKRLRDAAAAHDREEAKKYRRMFS